MKNYFELRSVIDSASPRKFAPWVRALYGKNGVYAIFNKSGTRAEYVGVSTGESLYGTLTRHFQKWERNEGTQYTGPVFNRKKVLVGIEIIPNKTQALAREQELIAALDPRLNRQVNVEEDNEDLGDEMDAKEPEGFVDGALDELSAFFDEIAD